MQLAAFSAPPVRAALEAANVRLVFIGSGEPAQAGMFIGSLKFPDGLPGELLLDPDTMAYEAFGLRKSVYASLVPSIMHGLKTHGLGAVTEGIRLGWKNAALVGDSWQQGGTFILSPLPPGQDRGMSASHYSHRQTACPRAAKLRVPSVPTTNVT